MKYRFKQKQENKEILTRKIYYINKSNEEKETKEGGCYTNI